MTRVVVVGSVNIDLVVDVATLPRPGQTVLALRPGRRQIGGKGANQAVAAAVFGADVALVACIGDDDQVERDLRHRGVDVTGALSTESTGLALITVAADGENTIVVDSGANMSWPAGLQGFEERLSAARVVVSQCEIPSDVVARAAALTRGRFVLNASPVREIDDAVLRRADPLVVNEHELADLTGLPVDSPEAALVAQRELRRRGVPAVVTTLGGAGAVWVDDSGEAVVPTVAVVARDTVGAGDAFAGVLAACLADGSTLGEAVEWALAAATHSVQSVGIHDSYGDRAAVAPMHARLRGDR